MRFCRHRRTLESGHPNADEKDFPVRAGDAWPFASRYIAGSHASPVRCETSRQPLGNSVREGKSPRQQIRLRRGLLGISESKGPYPQVRRSVQQHARHEIGLEERLMFSTIGSVYRSVNLPAIFAFVASGTHQAFHHISAPHSANRRTMALSRHRHRPEDKAVRIGTQMGLAVAFTRTLERSGSRLMIRSACAQCGESNLVSKHDGSLQDWEDGHRCQAGGEQKKGPASAQRVPALRLRKSAGRRNGGPREIS